MKAPLLLLGLAVCKVYGAGETVNEPQQVLQQPHPITIEGGKKIPIYIRPYNVALNSKVKTFLGGGALIAKNWVLTAATTVIGQKPRDLTVRVGSDDAYSGGTEIDVFDIITHPKFTGDWRYDLALVKLNQKINITKNSKPISISRILPNDGYATSVTGYGPTTYVLKTEGLLREAILPFVSYEVCKNKYKGANFTFTSLSFCTSKPGVGPCPLDWGDPLIYRAQLIGIFSGSKNDCGASEYPGVYANVVKFRKWIKDTITP